VLAGGVEGEKPLLYDGKGDKYTGSLVTQGLLFVGEKGERVKQLRDVKYAEAVEGSEWFLIFGIPKDRDPVRLRFIYPFIESWENVSLNEGQIEIELQATSPLLTSTPTVTTVPLKPTPTPSPAATVTEIQTPEEKGVPGFEVIFAIAGLLAMASLLRRKK